MPPPFDVISKMHPPREAWRLKVRVLRLWVVPSFGNHEVPNSMEMILLDEHVSPLLASLLNIVFMDRIVEGQVYRMAYFTAVSNHGSYRATSHEFKLVFLHRTTVVAVDEDVIPKTCFNMFPFSDLLNMTQDYDFLVNVIGLLTSVGEEKEYAKEGKIVKIIVLELTLKDLTLQCALFGDYVNQVNHFLASGYVEQPVVVIQLAKVKFLWVHCQVGLQNVMYATQMLFNPDLPEVVEFRQSMIEQGVNGTQPPFITNEGKVVSLEDDFMRLTRKCTIDKLQDNNELICGDTYPPIFQGLIGKKLLLKIDTKGVTDDKFHRTFRIRRICDDPTIIAMFELTDYDADDESSPKKEPDLHKSVPIGKRNIGIKKESSKTFIKSDKLAGTEFAALINHENGKDEKTPENGTEVLFHILDASSQYGEKLIHENHVVTSKGKRNLNPQFEEAATDADRCGSKIAKVNGV
ncbi:Replication protein A 70 kDa DNA-binding subunit B [Arachis hypogaea]|nr:Replication protein A 70 kDa DNA-binding subunit B [Arachis hypogaea]